MTRYTHAIVSRLPNNITLDGESGKDQPPDTHIARKEQEELCEALREAGVDVIELAPEESGPASSILVEDVGVVCNGTALVTKQSRCTRRKEVAALLMELGLRIVELDTEKEGVGKVLLEGSDVLFTGREFFVGIGKRSNIAGAMCVAEQFPEYPVTPIAVKGTKPFKYYVSMATHGLISVADVKEAHDIIKRIERDATFRYSTLTVPIGDAANCMNVNGTLIYRGDWADAIQKFRAVEEVQQSAVQMAELSKLGGIMSQHCLLFRRIKLLKKI